MYTTIEEKKSFFERITSTKNGALFTGNSLNDAITNQLIDVKFEVTSKSNQLWLHPKVCINEDIAAELSTTLKRGISTKVVPPLIPLQRAHLKFGASTKGVPQALWELLCNQRVSLLDDQEDKEQKSIYDEFNRRQAKLAEEAAKAIKDVYRENVQGKGHVASYKYIFADKKSQLAFNLLLSDKTIFPADENYVKNLNNLDFDAGECVALRIDSVWIKVDDSREEVLYGFTYTVMQNKYNSLIEKKDDGSKLILTVNGKAVENLTKSSRQKVEALRCDEDEDEEEEEVEEEEKPLKRKAWEQSGRFSKRTAR